MTPAQRPIEGTLAVIAWLEASAHRARRADCLRTEERLLKAAGRLWLGLQGPELSRVNQERRT